jgi:hypothetical protein
MILGGMVGYLLRRPSARRIAWPPPDAGAAVA